MKPTLVAIHQLKIADRVFAHGEEIEPDLLPDERLDWHIDHRQIVEYDPRVRRSLYRLFSVFSGCQESEQLSQDERDAYCLPE